MVVGSQQSLEASTQILRDTPTLKGGSLLLLGRETVTHVES